MGVQKEGKTYDRMDHDLVGLFGQIGGLIEFMNFFCMYVVYILCTNMMEAKSVNVFYKSNFSERDSYIQGKH